MKWCGGCQSWQDESAFNKDSSKPNGLTSRCRECKKGLDRLHYLATTEAHKEAVSRSRSVNPETARAATKRWRLANPEHFLDIQYSGIARRRALLQEPCGHGNSCQTISRRVVWGRDEGHCRIKLVCDGAFVPFEEMHLDHVVALAKGGLHCYYNVQTGCAPCNITKGAG